MLEKEEGESRRGPRRFRNAICLTPATSEKQGNSWPSWVEVTFLDRMNIPQTDGGAGDSPSLDKPASICGADRDVLCS